MTRLSGPALRVTIFLGESDTWHHRPLYTEIVHRAHAAGLAGASVFRGIEGFGASSLIHTSRLLSLSEDHRTVLVRAYYLGQTVADIAQQEGIPEGTVKSRLHYALRALRIALQERGVVR